MALEQHKLERIERLVQKNGGDIAVAVGRGFEQLAEQIRDSEVRIYSRLAELEDKLEAEAIAELEAVTEEILKYANH